MQATIPEIRAARAAEIAALSTRINTLNLQAAHAEAFRRGTRAHSAKLNGLDVALEVDWISGEPMVCWVWINGVQLDSQDDFLPAQINLWQAELAASSAESA